MSQSSLYHLNDYGQSFWWDSLGRRFLRDGTIERLRDEDDMRGITSNPSIFQAALSKGDDYDEEITRLAHEDKEAEEIFWELAVRDIQDACELLRPVFERSDGADGFVSLEVDPRLAYDTAATLHEVDRLWTWVDRPNLMVKVPATPEGMPAIRDSLINGRNINVTLLFGRETYREVMEVYLQALEARMQQGLPLSGVASVASFFVSRLDTLIDQRLEENGSEAALALRGKAAVANAKLAYQDFLAVFSGQRWEKLRSAGARVQRPLWASTSTKNPAYPDTLYVDPLIGRDTVNTLPTVTVEAYRDHGQPAADRVLEKVEESSRNLHGIETLGISMSAATDQLLREGVEKFEKSFDELLAALREKVEAVR